MTSTSPPANNAQAATPRPVTLTPEPGTVLGRFFFPEQSAFRLACARIACVAFAIGWWASHITLEVQTKLLVNDAFVNPQWIVGWLSAVTGEAALRNETIVYAMYFGTIAFGVMSLVGLFTRTSTLLFALGAWFQIATVYSYDDYHHPEGLLCVFLLVLPLSPCGRCLSIDAWRKHRAGKAPHWFGDPTPNRDAGWPLRTVWVLLAIMYFDAGASKVIASGPSWVNGYTLQTILFRDGLRWDMPLGVWLAQQPRWLHIILSMGALGLELTFWVILLKPLRWAAPLVLLAAASMHTGIYLTQKAPFFGVVAMYSAWIPFERLPFVQRAIRTPRAA
ncbi:MAG: HTTM domain-containing protein [Planctomycetota bacterium]